MPDERFNGMRSNQPQMPRTQYEVIQCGGGWDQITPTLLLKNGTLRNVLNFECNVTGGYTKISGYCRYDGQTSPISASYAVIWLTAYTNLPAVGNTVVNQASTASATVAAIYSDHLIITKITGTFAVADTVKVGSTVIATVIAQPATSMVSIAEDAINQVAAQNIYRALITAVPGVGAALGGFILNSVVYAFRATGVGNAVNMYKST